MFSHEKLHVYQKSIKWLIVSNEVLKCVPKGNAELVNQLKRASYSVSLNIAEGSGKIGAADKRRFYSISRGSALECAAILDIMEVLHIIKKNHITNGKELLYEIVSMLSRLCLK